MKMDSTLTEDMPSFKKRYKNQEENRLRRLREAKQNGDIKRMVENVVNKDLNPRKILTDKQRMAIYYLTDFVHSFKYKWVAARIGVDMKTLNLWRNDPLFMREMDKEITKRTSYMRGQAWRNVFNRITRGDIKVSLEYLKGIGDFKQHTESTDNTGEKELDDNELDAEINQLTKALSQANVPSDN
jgi:hypothetical protein